MKKKIEMIFKIIIPCIGFISLFDLDQNKYSTIPYISLIILLIGVNKYIKNIKIEKREKIVFSILTLIISLCVVLGSFIEKNYAIYDYSFLSDSWLILLQLLSISALLYPTNLLIFDKLKKLKQTENKMNLKKLLIVVFIILGCWSIYLINFFPGMMSPDSLNQWAQSINELELSNHHPIAHTMFIKIFSTIGNYFNNANLGVALYSITQMIIMAFIFAYVLYYMLKKNFNKYVVYLLIAFYAIVPIFGIFSITMWKDILFGGFSLILMLQVFKFTNEEKLTLSNKIVLIISIILTALFRSNGFYVIILLDILMLVVYLKKWKKICALFIIPTIISFLIIGPLYSSFNIKKPAFTENIGILIKQVYGVVYEKTKIDKESEKYLGNLADKSEALSVYTPYDDGIKMTQSYNNDYLEEHKAEFFKMWLRIGIKNPIKYAEIYLKSTYGFWYPESQGYVAHRWPIVENNFGLSSMKFNSLGLVSVFEKAYDMPLVKYLMSTALCLWIMLYCISLVIINKKYKCLISLSIPLLVWGTIMIATPLSYQPRYTFTLNCTVALMLYIGIESFEIKQNSKKRK